MRRELVEAVVQGCVDMLGVGFDLIEVAGLLLAQAARTDMDPPSLNGLRAELLPALKAHKELILAQGLTYQQVVLLAALVTLGVVQSGRAGAPAKEEEPCPA